MRRALFAMLSFRLDSRHSVDPFILAAAMPCCSGEPSLPYPRTQWKLLTFDDVRAPTGFVSTVPMWTLLPFRLLVRQWIDVLSVVPVMFTMPQRGTICLVLQQASATRSLFVGTTVVVCRVMVAKEQIETLTATTKPLCAALIQWLCSLLPLEKLTVRIRKLRRF